MGKYDRLTLPVLRQELEKRGAKRSGRKKELIERLEAYDRNSNFGCTTSDLNHDDDWRMSVPPATSYRDVTGNTILPQMALWTVLQL
ncbi:hypothetical protein LSAT2_008152 [Lamellibrachia satsuma]|nr:hypothetical protein LSAT2_008152 [Lamellibrachia satsuma]